MTHPQCSAGSGDAICTCPVNSPTGKGSWSTCAKHGPQSISEPQTSAVRLGDLVEMNHLCPYGDDYRGVEMKLIALRLGPDGEQWASVIEGDPRHRGHGVYDAETDGIRASWLSPLTRPQLAGGE